MGLIDYIIIGVVALGVAFSIFVLIKNKKRGKSPCGCDCGNCSGCSLKKKNEQDK